MAQVIKLKRTAVQGKVPNTSHLELGEIAINTYDGRIFFEKDDGTPSISEIVTTNADITGSITISGSISASSFSGTLNHSNVTFNGSGIVSGSEQINVTETVLYSSLATTGSNTYVAGQTILNESPGQNRSLTVGANSTGDRFHVVTNNTANSGIILSSRNSTNTSAQKLSFSGSLFEFNNNILPSTDNTISLGTSTQRFQLNGGTPVTVTGSGAPNTIARFSGSTELENSTITNTDTLTEIVHSNDGNIIFTVSGSNGELFTVTDSNTGNLLEVNDTSGIDVFTVSANGDVSASGAITASAFNIIDSIDVPNGITGSIAATNGVVSGSSQITDGSGILSSSNETFSEFSSSVASDFAGLSTDYNNLQNIPSGIVSQSSQTVAHLSNQDVDLGTGDLTATDITSTNFTINDTLTAPTITGSLLRLSENGTGLRLTNVGAFDNSSGDFRIFANQDLIFSTNGQSGTALTLDRTTKDATFVGAVTSSNLNVSSTGSFGRVEATTIDLDRLSLTSTQTTVPPLQLTAASLNDGVGALRIDSVEPDIFLNDTDGGFATITFGAPNDGGIGRIAIGRNNSDDFYLTVRDPNTNGGNWRNDTLVADSSTGNISLGYDLTVSGDLIVGGTTTTVNSETLNISSSLVRVNYGGSTVDGGLEVTDATGGGLATGSLLWDGTNDYWKAGQSGSEFKILLANGDGVVSGSSQITDGSGLVSGSDQLDGFVSKSADFTTNEIIISDGTNSVVSTDLLTIDPNNNRVGVGTSSPSTKFHIAGDGPNEGQIRLQQANDTNTDGPDIAFYSSRGTLASPSSVQNNDTHGRINAFPYNGTSFIHAGSFGWSGTDGTGNNTFDIRSRVSGTLAKRIEITSAGKVKFNDTYEFPTSDGSANQVLQTDGSGVLSFATISGYTDSDNTDHLNSLGVISGSDQLEGFVSQSGNFVANETIIATGTNSVTSSNILALDTSNNYLGINQSNPEVTLHMTGEGAQTAQIRMEQHNDSGDAPDIRTRRTRGTADSPTAVNAGDFIYRQNHEYYTGTEYRTVGQFAVDTNSTNADRFQLTLTVSEDGTAIDAADAQLKIDGNDGGAITFNNEYKFPTSDGTNGQALITNGSGTLSFGDVTSDYTELTNIPSGIVSQSAQVVSLLSNQDVDLGTGDITANAYSGSLNIPDSSTLQIGSQIFYPQGTNGFSVNEDFDISDDSAQTAYHFTSGTGRETVAFTLARTGQFTNGFGVYGTSADNTFVNFGEQSNTKFEWRRGVGKQPLDLDGGTLLATLDSDGGFTVTGGITGSIAATNGVVSGSSQITDLTTHKETVSGASSYAVTHNLNESYPIVQAWNTGTSQQEVPQSITTNSANQVTVVFSTTFAGVIIVKK